MDVIALVNDIKAGVQRPQLRCIVLHRHPARRDAIAREGPPIWTAPRVIAVRNAVDGSIVGRGAIRRSDGFALNTFRVETRR